MADQTITTRIRSNKLTLLIIGLSLVFLITIFFINFDAVAVSGEGEAIAIQSIILNLNDSYPQGEKIIIKVVNKGTADIYYNASGCLGDYCPSYVITQKLTGKQIIKRDPCLPVPTIYRIIKIKSGETKIIDEWNQKSWEVISSDPCQSEAKQVALGTYKISFSYAIDEIMDALMVIEKEIMIESSVCIKEGARITSIGQKCCPGLEKINDCQVTESGECICATAPGGATGYCTNCGDGICKPPENKCNCSLDCDNTKCKPEGYSWWMTPISRFFTCCDGLDRIGVWRYYPESGLCSVKADWGLCTDCGNGVCEKWESSCVMSCPEDCKEEIPDFYEPAPINEKTICSDKVCSLAIITTNSVFEGVKDELEKYQTKIKSEFNYQVEILKYGYEATAEQIKRDLSGLYLYKNLKGVILVGDIPTFKIGRHCEDYPTPQKPCLDYKPGTGAAEPEGGFFSFKTLDISDLLYADIDNLCEYNYNADAYYTDLPQCVKGRNIELPFWISRIYPHSSAGNDIEEIKKYFQNNLAYKEGEITFEKKHLAYAPIMSQGENKEATIFSYYNHLITGAGIKPYGPGEEPETDLNKIDDSDTETYKKSEITFLDDFSSDEKFFEELEKNYETVFLNGHGEPTWHQKDVTPDFIKNYEPKTIFFRFLSCSVGRFVEPDYLVGRYLSQGNILFATAATTRIWGSVINSFKDNFLLKQGAPFFQVRQATDRGASLIFGDPTIRTSSAKLRDNAPKARISEAKLNLGKILNGETKYIELKIKNEGREPLKIVGSSTDQYDYGTRADIASIYVSSSSPKAQGDVITLNENEIAKLTFRVQTNVPGKFNGNLYIATNDPEHYIIKIPFEGEVTEFAPVSPEPTSIPSEEGATLPVPDIMTQTENLKAQIIELQQRITQLTTQLNEVLKAEGKERIEEKPSAEGIPVDYTFTKSLYLGTRGTDIKYLQEFLKAQGPEIYPEGLVTGYYGSLTKSAVTRFQLKQGVVSSVTSWGAGYAGPKTRAEINEIISVRPIPKPVTEE